MHFHSWPIAFGVAHCIFGIPTRHMPSGSLASSQPKWMSFTPTFLYTGRKSRHRPRWRPGRVQTNKRVLQASRLLRHGHQQHLQVRSLHAGKIHGTIVLIPVHPTPVSKVLNNFMNHKSFPSAVKDRNYIICVVISLLLRRLCNFTLIHSLTGPVGQLFASRLGG